MESGGGKRKRRLSEEVDWLSKLPESLIFEVLLKLNTKDLVKCSALSSRWRNLWKYIPKLDLKDYDFDVPREMKMLAGPDCPSAYDRCVSFVDRFLGLNRRLEFFRINVPGEDYDDEYREPDNALIRRWIDIVIKRKVKHLEYSVYSRERNDEFQIPPTIYTCQSLVSLTLQDVTMSSPEFVYLPSLKEMDLTFVHFPGDLDLQRLISSCLALEKLTITGSHSHDLLVRSQSLLTFSFYSNINKDLVDSPLVVIDAPRLEFLGISDRRIANVIIKYPRSLARMYLGFIDEMRFDPADLPKRNMFHNFLASISCVKDMIITSTTLELFNDYSRYEPLPLFRNLTSLCLLVSSHSWETFPIYLKSCPNLKSFVLDYNHSHVKGADILPRPGCLLSSLEHVKMENASWNMEGIDMMKVLRYFLENSPILKKLTLYLGKSRKNRESVILEELLTIPRLSPSCQVVLL